ncbi:MAG: PHP domain-containing protein [Candidatus Woesearchaeota archaeon]|nr:PHP domain-containing protein [Candidatus Woesearchaeota archaeon]
MALEKYKRYDLHSHTKYSECSLTPVRTALKTALRRGLSGFAITDHNTIRGALEAKKLLSGSFGRAFRDRGFEFIVGEEILTDKGEVLAYYLNSEIKPGKILDVIDSAREQGALISIAHPYTVFRKSLRADLSEIRGKIDALECFNSRNIMPGRNAFAERAAERNNLGKTAGSDSHFWFEIGRAFTKFPESMTLCDAVRKRKASVSGTTIYSPPGFLLSAFSKALNAIKK